MEQARRRFDALADRLDAEEGGSILSAPVEMEYEAFVRSGPSGSLEVSCDALAFLIIVTIMLCAVPEIAVGMIIIAAELGVAYWQYCSD